MLKKVRMAFVAFLVVGLPACGLAGPASSDSAPQVATTAAGGAVAQQPAGAEDRSPRLVGQLGRIKTTAEDTLLDVAFRHGLGYVELVAANPGVDPWLPGEGTEVVLPMQHILPDAPHEGIVINLAEMRLYSYPPDGGRVETYPVGVGRSGKNTPTGQTTIAGKRRDPVWYPTEATRADNPGLPKVVGPGPDNPLGAHALDLGWPLYLIHGTNNVWGIGRRVSRGCIRMYPPDIERLFARVPRGTPVTVVDQPLKFAWHDGALYMEAHTTQTQAEQLERSGTFEPDPDLDLARAVGRARGARQVGLDWDRIREAVRARRGIPVRISR